MPYLMQIFNRNAVRFTQVLNNYEVVLRSDDLSVASGIKSELIDFYNELSENQTTSTVRVKNRIKDCIIIDSGEAVYVDPYIVSCIEEYITNDLVENVKDLTFEGKINECLRRLWVEISRNLKNYRLIDKYRRYLVTNLVPQELIDKDRTRDNSRTSMMQKEVTINGSHIENITDQDINLIVSLVNGMDLRELILQRDPARISKRNKGVIRESLLRNGKAKGYSDSIINYLISWIYSEER